MTLGFLVGLGTVGCTEHNPAFHKPVDGGVGPTADAAVDTPTNADRLADTWIAPKDAEPRLDTPVLADTRLDGVKLVDSEAETAIELPDARESDGRAADTGGQDTKPDKDADLDTLIPDTAVVTIADVPPANLDVEQADVPTPVQDTATTPPELDAPEADTNQPEDVMPDVEPDVWPDAEDAEPDSL